MKRKIVRAALLLLALLLASAYVAGALALSGTDPLLALMESLKWCFRLSCHIAVSYLQKNGFSL